MGFVLERGKTSVMGILNVTPDSFSDGGHFFSEPSIVKQVELLLDQGADIIDVGGESTRPFAAPVSLEEELQRVVPVIRIIRKMSNVPVSVDTTKAVVAREALAAGANIVNDISALQLDPEMVAVIKTSGCPTVLMHMQGTPDTMQVNPHYGDVVEEINTFFSQRLEWLAEQGVSRNQIILDPGIGFGKTLEHNLTILRNALSFRVHSCPLLFGFSRKSFFDALLGGVTVEERDCPTAVVSALCNKDKVEVLRVHNVKATRQAIVLAQALN